MIIKSLTSPSETSISNDARSVPKPSISFPSGPRVTSFDTFDSTDLTAELRPSLSLKCLEALAIDPQ